MPSFVWREMSKILGQYRRPRDREYNPGTSRLQNRTANHITAFSLKDITVTLIMPLSITSTMIMPVTT